VSEQAKIGEVRSFNEGRICRIVIDNAAKRNAFSPEMMLQLSDALTRFDADASLWGEDLSKLPGWCELVSDNLLRIVDYGMRPALEQHLGVSTSI
jgi:hypothetical protein